MSCNNNCLDDCSCIHQHNAQCIFYNSDTLSCIDVTKGDDLETILKNINDTVCALSPSSITVYNVQGTTNQIVVTPTTVGNTTTFTVSLSNTVITALTNIGAAITSLQTCVAGAIVSIATDTPDVISVFEDGSGTPCGKEWKINFVAPSSIPPTSGIIYNDSTKVGATGGTGVDLTLKSSLSSIYDYQNNIGFEVGDEIRWRATGQIDGGVGEMDDVKFDLFDTPTGILNGDTFGSFSQGVESSWLMNGTITILDNTSLNSTLLVSVTLQRSQTANDVVGNAARDIYVINKEVTGVDLSSLILRIRYVRNVNSSYSATNFARQLMVEVVKAL